MGKDKVDFSRGALTKKEIEAMDDRGAGFYENLMPPRLVSSQQPTSTEGKTEEKIKQKQPKSGPRKESE